MELGNYMIYGTDAKGRRGGAYHGILVDTDRPAFGGANLIHAPIWWNTTAEEVQKICDKIMTDYKGAWCYPKKVD